MGKVIEFILRCFVVNEAILCVCERERERERGGVCGCVYEGVCVFFKLSQKIRDLDFLRLNLEFKDISY